MHIELFQVKTDSEKKLSTKDSSYKTSITKKTELHWITKFDTELKLSLANTREKRQKADLWSEIRKGKISLEKKTFAAVDSILRPGDLNSPVSTTVARSCKIY